MPNARRTATETRRVVLVFGDPGNGKSHLATALHEKHGYAVLSLDDVYVNFVRERFQALYLPALERVIAQHFQTILAGYNGGAAVQAWVKHLVELVTARSQEHRLLVVEGFLLPPALSQIQQALPSATAVMVVEAKQRQYFVAQSIDFIHRGR
jgi:dephospho-CoA kinase